MHHYGAFRLPSFCIGRRLSTLVFCGTTRVMRTNIHNAQTCCERQASADVDRCTAMKSECTIMVRSDFIVVHRKFRPRKFKRGIGSLFDPVLTLWGGGHIGSSRMEQSYCTSGFFRQRVNARNHRNYQPTPKHRIIIAYGKRKNARRDECVAVCVICFIIF